MAKAVRPMHMRIVCGLVLVACAAGCGGPVMAPVQTRDRDQTAAPEVTGTSPAAVQPAQGQHIVQRGDTMYSIAWRYGLDYRDIARWNNIGHPYLIIPGQVLRLQSPAPPAPAIATTPPAPARAPAAIPLPAPAPAVRVEPATSAPDPNPAFVRWQWPTGGKVIQSRTPTSKNGIDISGRRGQTIVAAAAGSVVYSGSGLLGYGRLIIVKHSDTYLSAYAHNETLLVKEGDRVNSGQQIATMGIGSGGTPVLHFEIRKDGKPINPLEHLPKARP